MLSDLRNRGKQLTSRLLTTLISVHVKGLSTNFPLQKIYWHEPRTLWSQPEWKTKEAWLTAYDKPTWENAEISPRSESTDGAGRTSVAQTGLYFQVESFPFVPPSIIRKRREEKTAETFSWPNCTYVEARRNPPRMSKTLNFITSRTDNCLSFFSGEAGPWTKPTKCFKASRTSLYSLGKDCVVKGWQKISSFSLHHVAPIFLIFVLLHERKRLRERDRDVFSHAS